MGQNISRPETKMPSFGAMSLAAGPAVLHPERNLKMQREL